MLESRVDGGLSRHQVRKDVSIHERGMEGEAGGRVRPATVASRVLCLRRWGPSKKRGGSDGEEEKY